MEDIDSAAPDVASNSTHDSECCFVVKIKARGSIMPNSALNVDESDVPLPNSSKTTSASPYLPEYSRNSATETIPPLVPKPFYFKASSIAGRNQWIDDINSALRAFQRQRGSDGKQRIGSCRAFQLRLQSIYTSTPFQAATAITVGLNFFLTVSATAEENNKEGQTRQQSLRPQPNTEDASACWGLRLLPTSCLLSWQEEGFVAES
jgi:hypothetical protein